MQELKFDTKGIIMEYQIAHTISKVFNFKQLNHLPHKTTQSPFLIKKFNITKKRNEIWKIKTIYNRIINDLDSKIRHVINSKQWKDAHNPILPNYYSKTFNYKLLLNILPF